MAKDGLEVNEVDYKRVSDGPREDTDAFYHGTPAPGSERSVDGREPRAARILAKATPGWIKRVGRPPDAEVDAETPVRPMVLAGIAACVFAGMSLVAVVVVWFMLPHKIESKPRVEEPAQERYQGLEVKKGLH